MVAEPTVVNDVRPLIAVLTPMVAVVAIAWSGEKRKNLREIFTLLAGLVQASVVLSLTPLVLAGNVVEFHVWQIFTNVPMLLRVDGFGLIFAAVASVLWIATSLYAIGYMRGLHEHTQTRFYSFFGVSLCATMGVAFSANLLTIYFFYEMLSVSTYPLVTHMQDKEARKGGRTYLSYLLFTSLCLLLPALSWCYVWLDGGQGAMDFLAGNSMSEQFSGTTQIVLLLLFTFGFAKAGLMPFHSWLPNAMVAPTPVSALLHAVAVVKVGVFCVIRVYSDIFGIEVLQALDGEQIMVWIACATILISSLIALSQDNLKRRLAFSTIGQLGYVVLGATLATKQGMGGAVLHIAMHACGKITLFFCAGAILVASGKKYVSELRGLGRKMPFTMAAFLIGSLSVIGLPPLGGFVSKWYLVLGALDRDYVWVVVVLLVSSLLNVFYLLPVAVSAFFRTEDEKEGEGGIQEAPWQCVVPLSCTALGCFGLFLFSDVLLSLAGLAN
ncbi:MAG: monovalent cation/H+ antiporter subunit D family protein [Opitutae bacterium]|nr:monovalent cation/H+ antiporter subunit D family protein [Opitutae bacterium]MBT6849920.1 monovalent cation/H+ antiporter subunit D family protein [Opitutae bacterium]MBT7742450.1 monovalent cation/H+ antiporter subunit D family protein [Opitutae bacterium]